MAQAATALGKMHDTTMVANVIRFSATISVCGKGGQQKQAAALHHDVREFSMITNVISFSAAMLAASKGKVQYTRSKL